MPNRERYRRKALECVRAVERMHDPAERAKLLEVAKAYMNLSQHVAERHEHGTAHRGADHDPARRRDDA